MSVHNVTETKAALRRLFRGARRAFLAGLSTADRDALHHSLARHAAAVVQGFALPGSYAAIGEEIDPIAIEQGLPATAFPRVVGTALHFHKSARADLKPGYAGILEPSAAATRVTPDILLVPLVAVTLAGVRLGQGMGHYDRALAALRQTGPIRTVALAWDCQIADALPADPWDIPVDYIATPTRLVDCAAVR